MVLKNLGPQRKLLAGLTASFLVIACGMSFSIAIALVASPNDPKSAILVVIALFAVISLIPIWLVRPGKTPLERAFPRESLWSQLKRVFERPKERSHSQKYWKRRRTREVPQPYGSEYVSAFIAERRGPESDAAS